MRYFLVVAAICLWSLACRAETVAGSGNYYLPACYHLLRTVEYQGSSEFREGVCVGVAQVLRQLGPSLVTPRWCPPSGTSNRSALKVIVDFLLAHPERLDERFVDLARDALREAWSCK